MSSVQPVQRLRGWGICCRRTVLRCPAFRVTAVRCPFQDLANVQDIGCVCDHVLRLNDVGYFVDAAQGAEVVLVFVDVDMCAVEAKGCRWTGEEGG